jgi:hypothetical protein
VIFCWILLGRTSRSARLEVGHAQVVGETQDVVGAVAQDFQQHHMPSPAGQDAPGMADISATPRLRWVAGYSIPTAAMRRPGERVLWVRISS